MQTKSRKMHLLEIAEEYRSLHGNEFELEELVAFAINNNLWEPKKTPLQLGIAEFREALRSAKDDDGNRIYVCASYSQQTFWGHRNDVSWDLRQKFLDDQAARVEADKRAVERMRDVLNEERRKGEPEFQLRFSF